MSSQFRGPFPRPDWAVVLGSGMGGCFDNWPLIRSLHYSEAGLTPPEVSGHSGVLDWRIGPNSGIVLIASGRLHAYEGHKLEGVFQLVDFFKSLQTANCLLTCATGGIRPDLEPGTLVGISKSIFFNTVPPWITEPGRSLTKLDHWPGAFPDQRLFRRLQKVQGKPEIPFTVGVHAQMSGPCYETRAEIRMLSRLGVTTVGMSTGMEMARATQLKMPTVAVAVVANPAAGLGPGKISHLDVLDSMKKARGSLGSLLNHLVLETKSFQDDQ